MADFWDNQRSFHAQCLLGHAVHSSVEIEIIYFQSNISIWRRKLLFTCMLLICSCSWWAKITIGIVSINITRQLYCFNRYYLKDASCMLVISFILRIQVNNPTMQKIGHLHSQGVSSAVLDFLLWLNLLACKGEMTSYDFNIGLGRDYTMSWVSVLYWLSVCKY